MTKEKESNMDPSWKGVIKWGGLSLFAGAVWVVIFVPAVFITGQTMPVPAKEALESPMRPTMLFLGCIIGELLLMPGVLGLYFALKKVRKTPMFLATALWLITIPMWLASRGLIISLSQISARYVATTSEAMKAAYLASAELALETQNIYSATALMLLCVASVMIGLVMLKGVFGKRIGYVLIVAGIFTFFSPLQVLLGVPTIIPFIGLILTAFWQLVVGLKLYKLGKEV